MLTQSGPPDDRAIFYNELPYVPFSDVSPLIEGFASPGMSHSPSFHQTAATLPGGIPSAILTLDYLFGIRVPSFTGGSILMLGPWTIGNRPAP